MNVFETGLKGLFSKKKSAWNILTLFAAATFTGCAVGPDYTQPELELPDAWTQQLVSELETPEAPLHAWWRGFNDPVLNGLIEQAAADNLSLKAAVARIEAAGAVVGVERGDFFPQVSASGSSTTTRNSFEMGQPPALRGDRNGELHRYGFAGSWELDFWGRVRRQVEAASGEYEATVENYRDSLVLLYANVANAYFDIRALQTRLQFARENLQLQADSVQLTRDRREAGLSPELDVQQALLNFHRTEAAIPVLERQLKISMNRLAILVGQAPGALDSRLLPAASLPFAPDAIQLSPPAEALRSRPDVRQAERALAAQTARIGATKGLLYPQLSLLGNLNWQAAKFDRVFNDTAMTYSAGPSLQWAIFSGGSIRSAVNAEEARTEAALQVYHQAVLQAMEDVENTLARYVAEQRRVVSLEASVEAARRSVELVNELYRSGLTDFQNVLDTERALATQQDQLAESRGIVLQSIVGVYRGLGGGWAVDWQD